MASLVLSTALCIAGLIIIYWLHSQPLPEIIVEPSPPPPDAPLISICIPARDEEQNIRTCVESALAQDYPNFEVIVLDDRSTDATPRILGEIASRDSRLRLLNGSDLPFGWAGKPHALHQASAAARGGWLCFVDADTFLSPSALSSCYAKAIETRADLFTTLHHQIMDSFWEKTVMPLIMTGLAVGFNARKVNDPSERAAIASGQFMLMRRETYESIGGHEAVKNEIVEDQAIAELAKWSGHRLVLADGRSVIQTRMYTSLQSMWEGWTKNIYLGLSRHRNLLFLGVFGAALGLLASLFLPVWSVLGWLWLVRGGGASALAILLESLAVWGAILFARGMVAKRLRVSPLYSLTTPLGAGVFAALMIVSAWKVLSGRGVTWRGRKYHSK
jgi:chlorobactene glucosyltransferase